MRYEGEACHVCMSHDSILGLVHEAAISRAKYQSD